MATLAISEGTAGLLLLVGAVVVASLLVCLLGWIFRAAVEADNVFITGIYVLVLIALVLGYAYALWAVLT